jgi:YYY domain-containing protein
MGGMLLSADFLSFISWWFVLFLLGITFLPFTSKMFSSFHDNGYLFSKTIGIAISGYVLWLLTSIKVLKFTSISCIIVVIICLIVNGFILFKSNSKDKNKTKVSNLLASEKLSSIFTEELMFLVLFLIWTYIRGFKPEAYGTEKFMDYGFMTTMMRAEYMPPQDLWFSGSTINYYYVGQYVATFLTKLSNVSVNVGYNLMLMTLAALAFVLPYSLVLNITKNIVTTNKNEHKKAPVIAGLLSGAGVSLAGNMHFPLFYWVIPTLQTILGIKSEDSKFWFPDSTRYIGYNPDTTDKTIHEFPNYSFVLGDLHAHVINIMFVLTVLGVLYGWLLYRKKYIEKNKNVVGKLYPNLLKEVLNPFIIIIGFFIGLFHTTNFWDFPIYYVVAGAVILYSNLIVYEFKLRSLLVTAIQGIFIIVLSELVALPFTLNFDQISTRIEFAVARTPFYQLFILWGLQVILILGLLIELINKNKSITNNNDYSIDLFATDNKKTHKDRKNEYKNHITQFFVHLNVSDAFILLLGLCAIGLVFMPEVIYVKDIYSGDYKRANTMFKLTYQAFILFGTCSGYIFVKFLKKPSFKWQTKFTIITLVLFLSSCWYAKVSINAWYGNVFLKQNYKGIDAAAFMETTLPEDYLAIKWLNDNIKGTPVVLEANGDSYSDYQRVSVITGLPTVVGWYVHEWLWRDSTEVVDERVSDIKEIYTSENVDTVLSLIDKYNIEYIYVGKLEYDKYTTINDTLLKSLGTVVYSQVTNVETNTETYIVKIDPKVTTAKK